MKTEGLPTITYSLRKLWFKNHLQSVVHAIPQLVLETTNLHQLNFTTFLITNNEKIP